MEFIADLHLHSRFSRATAKNLDLENVYRAACLKGITLVATGDFTHPEWVNELETKLEPAEAGLYKLKSSLSDKIDRDIFDTCRGKAVRFILQCEISSIYKKDERVRKNHNLIYFPTIEIVKKFNRRLDAIGNISSDGRPILGLDASRLLEIMLEISQDGFFIPAHIWTPWFSMLGSKSGFDSIEECFGALSHHIFAVETGLSSDPPMNWRVPGLDHVRLVSSSDAHSPMYIGRNATRFNTGLSFFDVRKALESGNMKTYLGTIDMFPEEGKYHYDGHRKCNVCMNPSETLSRQGLCPACGKPVTLGVLYRVQELAERPEGYTPDNRHGYKSIIPLADILSEIFEVGPKTKKVSGMYDKALKALGPELDILLSTEIENIEKTGIPLLAEAVQRMRHGDIIVSPGFDGEYGKVKIFDAEEKKELKGEKNIFDIPGKKKIKKSNRSLSRNAEDKINFPKKCTSKKLIKKMENSNLTKYDDPSEEEQPFQIFLDGLNKEQKQAVFAREIPLLIAAGPGTGKTRTLTARIAALISKKKIDPSSILALTFTSQAAKEMENRIFRIISQTDKFLPNQSVTATTFHGFCLKILKEYTAFTSSIIDENVRMEMITSSIFDTLTPPDGKISAKTMESLISTAKQNVLTPDDDLSEIVKNSGITPALLSKVWRRYNTFLKGQNLVDFEDIIQMALHVFSTNDEIKNAIVNRFLYIFVDEYQDINKGQYLLIRHLSGDGTTLCVIGDPDQSIYGFRGSDNSYFKRFSKDYANSEKIVLKQNYRSSKTILEASFQLISKNDDDHAREKVYSSIEGQKKIIMLESSTERGEAVSIGKKIERLVGGISMFSMDAGKADAGITDQFSFSDFAVLYRTRKQGIIFNDVFKKAGIPFQTADRDDVLMYKGIRELISFLRLASSMGTVVDLEIALDHMGTATGKVTRQRLKNWLLNLNIPLSESLAIMNEKSVPGIRKDIYNKIASAGKQLVSFEKKNNRMNTTELLMTIVDEHKIAPVINHDVKSLGIFQQLLHDAENFPDKFDFLENIAMKKDAEFIDNKAEKVSFLTMHAAKGLEFSVVFVAGCEQGLIPFCHKKDICSNPDEERRLFYVAMTRAKKLLYLSRAKKRNKFGKTVKSMKSPFLYDIEDELKSYSRNKYKKADKKIVSNQMELFSNENSLSCLDD